MLPLQYLANNSPKDNTNPNMTWGTSNYPTYTLFDNDTIGKFAHLHYTQIYGDVKYFKLLEQLAVVCKAIWPRAAMWSTKGNFKKCTKIEDSECIKKASWKMMKAPENVFKQRITIFYCYGKK